MALSFEDVLSRKCPKITLTTWNYVLILIPTEVMMLYFPIIGKYLMVIYYFCLPVVPPACWVDGRWGDRLPPELCGLPASGQPASAVAGFNIHRGSLRCKPHETLSRPRCAPSLYRVQRRILYLGVGAQKIYWSCCWVQNKLYFWTNVYRFYILFFVFHPILQRCNLCLSIQLLLLMIAEFKGPFKY